MKKPVLKKDGGLKIAANVMATGRNMHEKLLIPAIVFLILSLSFSSCRKDDLKNVVESPHHASSKSAATASAIAGLTPFKVLSFNVRHNDPGDPQTITERQTLIRQIIIDNSPDVFGLQEFSDNSFESWFRTEMANLGYGEYYDTTITGTPKAIFFKTSRFTLEDSGTLDIGPTNTGTWVILSDNITSKKYFISNSHWQFDSQSVRIENAQKLADGIQLENTQGLPEIVFGDFNAVPGTTEILNFKADLDVVDALGDTEGDYTFHGWTSTGTKKLDWMMSDRSMSYTTSSVITTSYNGYWPSDHWPVSATYVPAIFGGPHVDANGISGSANTKFYFADVDGDGQDDKIYWNYTFDSGKTRVFLSNGNGTFASSAVTHTAGASTDSSTRYFFADVNGDGKADEIRWNPALNSGHTRVYLATTGGNFSSTVIDNPEGTSGSSSTIYNFADINGDGKADKIYWNPAFDSGHTRVYLATSGGSFSGTVVSGTTGSSTTAGTTFYYADVNADGKADKILWHPSLNSGKTMVYLSDGDGTFTSSSSFSNSGATSVSSSTRFYFTDVNGDGRADKIYWNPTNYLGKLKAYFSQTNSEFEGPIYSLRGTSQSANTQFYFADINGGGKSDQIRWNYGENSGELRNYFGN